MQRSLQQRTYGFTLVEILVVIVIIAILAALATPAILSAMHNVETSAIILEINTMAQAVEAYRTEHGAYPPDFTDPQAVLDHLNRIHPRRANVERELATLTHVENFIDAFQMGPTRALPFWLRGFHPNPEFPLSGDIDDNGQPESDRQSLIEFNVKMIAGGDGDLETLETPLPDNRKDFEVLTPSRGPKVPLVYFNSYTCAGCNGSYRVRERNDVYPKAAGAPGFGQVRPYVSAKTDDFVNPKTFQIIAAGRDGQFGEFGTDPFATKQHGSGARFTEGDWDNLANFSETNFRDAIE